MKNYRLLYTCIDIYIFICRTFYFFHFPGLSIYIYIFYLFVYTSLLYIIFFINGMENFRLSLSILCIYYY